MEDLNLVRLALLAARNSIHTVRWANEMAQRGHEVHLFSLQEGGDDLDSRVHLHILPSSPPCGYYREARRVRGILSELKPDVVHAHYASGYGTLGRLSGYHPYVLSVWGSDVYDFPYKSPLHKQILLRNIRSADWICSTSNAMASQTRKICPGTEQITVVPFGIDLDSFCAKTDAKNTETITVGTVKTLAPEYGIDVLVKAFAQAHKDIGHNDSNLARQMRLVIVGDGPSRPSLEQLASDEGIADITTFMGRVPHSTVPDYLNHLDVYVAVSRSESFGVAIIEASACELPVIVSDAEGLSEVVKSGKTGLIVKKENVEETAEAIETLVENAELRNSLGRAGRQHVSSLYDWKGNASLMEKVYARVYQSHM